MGEIPANTYKGQEREVAVPAVMAILVARSALPEDLVYRFTKAVFDNLTQFHSAHAAARNLTPRPRSSGWRSRSTRAPNDSSRRRASPGSACGLLPAVVF
jgi:TRAP-type uncharacterized transport system substrate-binding protein